jgi:hypothetical protein
MPLNVVNDPEPRVQVEQFGAAAHKHMLAVI